MKKDKSHRVSFILGVASALIGGVLSIVGHPEFLGIAAVGLAVTLHRVIMWIRGRDQDVPSEDMANWIRRNTKWYVAFGFLVIIAGVVKGMILLHDDPARALVSFAASVGAVAVLVRWGVGVRRLRAADALAGVGDAESVSPTEQPSSDADA
jgi:hypothetical protein